MEYQKYGELTMGPPMNSAGFQNFSTQFGFKHRKITPIWPQANGECERFMKTIGKNKMKSYADTKRHAHLTLATLYLSHNTKQTSSPHLSTVSHIKLQR